MNGEEIVDDDFPFRPKGEVGDDPPLRELVENVERETQEEEEAGHEKGKMTKFRMTNDQRVFALEMVQVSVIRISSFVNSPSGDGFVAAIAEVGMLHLSDGGDVP